MALQQAIFGIVSSMVLGIAPLSSATWDLPATDLTAIPPDSRAQAPSIGIDGAGNTTAIWYFNVGAPQSYMVSESKPVGGSWSGVRTTISVNTPGVAVDAPQMSMNNAGQAQAVWHVQDANGSHIQANTMRALEAWQTMNGTNVSDATFGKQASDPHVGTNEAGGGVAVWLFNSHYIQAAQVDSYGNWLSPTDLSDHSNPLYTATTPKIAVNSAGAAVAVWAFDDGAGNKYIQARRMNSGGVWDLVVNLAGPLSALEMPYVAMNDNGEAVATWTQGSSPTKTVHASNMTSGGVWSGSQLLSDGGLDSKSASVVLDNNGNAAAVWVSQDNPLTFSQTRAATQLAGQSWTPAGGEVISDSVTTGTIENTIKIGVDNSGKVVVAWIGVALPLAPPFPRTVFGATKPFGESWDSPPTTLSSSTNDFDGIGLDVNGTGAAAVVWGFSKPTTIIQATGQGGSPVPPTPSHLSATGMQVASRFAMQTEYSNQLNWVRVGGSIVGYHIYRNGTLIGAVPASQLEYQDQFQRKNARVTYRVAAVNNVGCEIASGTVTIN